MVAWISLVLSSLALLLILLLAAAAMLSYSALNRKIHLEGVVGLEAEIAALKVRFRSMEQDWENTYAKMRTAVGRVIRERQVAEGRHKGGENAVGAVHEEGEPQEEQEPEEPSYDDLWKRVMRARGA